MDFPQSKLKVTQRFASRNENYVPMGASNQRRSDQIEVLCATDAFRLCNPLSVIAWKLIAYYVAERRKRELSGSFAASTGPAVLS
jgi:hypothetical protein